MEKEFVSYELAVKLKSLGFDEECFGFYNPTVTEKVIMNNDSYGGYGLSYEHIVGAPTFSQAFRWFRDKKLSDGSVCRHGEADGGYSYRWDILHEYGVYEERHFQKGYKTYEEAELACLERLIDKITNKKIFDFVTDL